MFQPSDRQPRSLDYLGSEASSLAMCSRKDLRSRSNSSTINRISSWKWLRSRIRAALEASKRLLAKARSSSREKGMEEGVEEMVVEDEGRKDGAGGITIRGTG